MNHFAQKLGLNLGSLTSLARSLKIDLPRQPGESDGSYATRLNYAVRTWKQSVPRSEPQTAVVSPARIPPPEPSVREETPSQPESVPIPEPVEVDSDEANLAAVEKVVAQFTPGDEDARNTLRLVVAASIIGTNADKLARLLGLNRDKFVRPRAKRLRDNGIWVDGKIAVYTASGSDADIRLGILLAALVAEDLVELTE